MLFEEALTADAERVLRITAIKNRCVCVCMCVCKNRSFRSFGFFEFPT